MRLKAKLQAIFKVKREDMKTSKHTEGPWRVQSTSDAQAVRIFADSVYLGSICNSDFTVCQNFYNAKLMAAAPDLLAALMLAKDMMIANDLSLPNTFEVIDEAIAKARGE